MRVKVLDHAYTGGGVNIFVGEIGDYNFVCEDGGESVEYFDKSLGINSTDKYGDLEDAYTFEMENAKSLDDTYNNAVAKAVAIYALSQNDIDYNDKYKEELRKKYMNESINRKRITESNSDNLPKMSGKDLRDFKQMMVSLESNGKVAKRGNWYVGNGGYDLFYEIYYKDVPVIDCVDGSMQNLTSDEVFDFYAKLFADTLGYNNEKLNESKKRSSLIYVTCYNDTEIFTDRQKAINYYTDGIYGSDGHEQERYIYIVSELKNGSTDINADEMDSNPMEWLGKHKSKGDISSMKENIQNRSLNRNHKLKEGIESIDKKETEENAMWVYKNCNRPSEWQNFTDDELVYLISLCCITDSNPYGRAFDDEVFDEADSRENGEELVKRGQEMALANNTNKLDESFIINEEAYILSTDEYNALDKMMTKAHLDDFMIGNYDDDYDQNKEGDTFYDFTNEERVDLATGLGWVAGAFTSPEDYDLTSKEYRTLQKLMKKYGYSI